MSDWWFWLTWCSMAIILLYIHFEFHYFLRMCICVLLARFIKKKSHILDTTTVYGICLTNDIDTLLCHMNNARYLRELDFARADFYERTRLYPTILSKGGSVYQGAATIRYRKLIKPLSLFRITSKIVYWDNQSIYMEHRFIRPSDDFIHCIAICRQRILKCSIMEILNELLIDNIEQQQQQEEEEEQQQQYQQQQWPQQETNLTIESRSVDHVLIENGRSNLNIKWKPQLPPDIGKWIEYNDLSSQNLRQNS